MSGVSSTSTERGAQAPSRSRSWRSALARAGATASRRSWPSLALSMLLILLMLAYLLVDAGTGADFDYVLPRRLWRLGAMVVGGVCVAWSSVVFQTLTRNRVLTPAVMGYEAVYLLLQSLLVLLLGTASLAIVGATGNFVASVLLMLGYSWALQRWMFRGGRQDAPHWLLLGLVLTLIMGTVTQFVQFSTSPGEFSVLLGFAQASFNRAQPEQLLPAAVIVVGVVLIGLRQLPTLDVLALGRDQAMSLGVDHARAVRGQLALIATLVAVSTSLLGPTAFMGLFVANLAHALARSSRHRHTLPAACAIAVGVFVAAQFAVEQFFNYRTTVGILVNLMCGVYFLALVIRTRGVA